MGNALPHAIQLRYQAEELVRLRPAHELRRYVSSQRAARIDPNPHQMEAVIFALERIVDGGCILADEVGLGKTIEAGLVISQLIAEGKHRVLMVAPKPLMGQWRQELMTLFGLDVSEGSVDPGAFDGTGVFVTSRDLVGSARGAEALARAGEFDLVVVDEAHEIFSGIHKRFDKWGEYREDGKEANMAHRLRQLLRRTGAPVLLLTATPIQNSLLELWALVHYVEPTGTLLGDLRTFRETFCPVDDRQVQEGQEDELRDRLARVCQRTLRRQAQEFLERPFVAREARLYEYQMGPEERELYDAVTAYLLRPGIAAFRGNARQLLLITYHRRMASSQRALSASLRGIAERLRKMLRESGCDDEGETSALAADLEDEDVGREAGDTEPEDGSPLAPELVRKELAEVEDFIARSEALGVDSKALALIKATRLVFERGARGEGSGKVLIFTESLTTQDYLAELLVEAGLVSEDEITLFRGTNKGPRAAAALERWKQEVGDEQLLRRKGGQDIAVRMALVHEFRTRSRVFISTEAGAKGLNLQFCETLVNYDLPWNPQRIEQRIGRCHRYGQTRDVTVINFLASDNEAQRLTFEILSRKLELFGNVLDASDAVLHKSGDSSSEALVSAVGPEFERELRRIHERARTLDEQVEELRALRERLDDRRERYESTHRRTVGLIQSRLDAEVQRSFRDIQQQVPDGLADLDRDLERFTVGFLRSRGIGYTQHGNLLELQEQEGLPPEMGEHLTACVGETEDPSVERLHVAHPWVREAVAHVREAAPESASVRIRECGDTELHGMRGRLAAMHIRYPGFEPIEHVVLVGLAQGRDELLTREQAAALIDAEIVDAPEVARTIDEADMDDAIDEAIFEDREPQTREAQKRFERTIGQVERFVEDRILVLRRQRDQLVASQRSAEERRDAAVGAEARSKAEQSLRSVAEELDGVLARLNRLQARDDDAYERWRQQAHDRRFEAPTWTRLFDVDFEVE